MKVYVEGRDNPDKDLANKERILPKLEIEEALNCNDLMPDRIAPNPLHVTPKLVSLRP